MDEHTTQRAFRQILEAMTFPGKIIQLEKGAVEMSPLISQTVLVCQTLLDSEVTFTILNDSETSHSIHAYTGSHAVSVREADFIVIPQEATSMIDQLNWAKTGDLRDPQKSATLVYEVESLTNGSPLELRGPGIKDKTVVHANLTTDFLEIRARLNAEYPLGVDAIFIDGEGYILALPRTTKVSEVK